MDEPPVYTPLQQPPQSAAYPPPGSYPQGQPGYPQGQPGYPQGQVAYPQGQAVAYPQGQVAYPQGQAVAYPQGQPVAYPQGQVTYPQGQPGVAYPPGQQVVITQGVPATHVYHTGSQGCCADTTEHFNGKAGLVTGVVHLIAAVLSIILGGVAYTFPVIQIGYGIWSAILFIIPTGLLGVVSRNKQSCVIIAYMVMSILCSWTAFGMLAYETVVSSVLSYYQHCYFSFTGFDSSYICNYEYSAGSVIIHAFLAFLALIEVINSIVGAAYCCGGHPCCCGKPSAPTTTTVQYSQTAAQPMTVTAQKYAPGPGADGQ
nr:calcium-binding protein P-like isoform X1 [Lytechinus pictus]